MKKIIITILSIPLLFSCGGEQRSETDVTLEDPKEELTNLEKEHLLEKVAYADSVNAGLTEDTFKGSARREAKASIGDASVTVNYGSPGKRGRVIWNGLVSYDQVWVSGSHWATAVTFSDDVVINDVEVPAGMYAFFTIPGRETWTLILNKNYDQHLADSYEESEDVVRVVVPAQSLDKEVQRLTYEVESISNTEGTISLSWDQVKVSMPFSII
ncbi:DUF2911 domain-containing protein [Belliella kenyensis]|uniref:DUF2911 domain-containing protein n=1 Tax=Belliella kenyensis TaxID=1472724 RepID=A0ABV8EKX8_9BACT|nr:DUF2911 domain-containing protein [Belliella kenyensis]MCH7402718.1 DUF2911 domain-containing protein [Belliella kenyensis]MDN3603734.1 DUF2911 domain-containing protein [Belliella kenyensis]